MNRAVFFDRDGTLMAEVGYCGDPSRVSLLPRASEAVRTLRAAGFQIFLVSNQSGIGRGYFSEEDFAAVQREFFRQLEEPVDATYYSADAPDVSPSRRKPAPDMLLEAAAAFDVDLSRSFMVGDREGDIQAGRAAGCRTVLVLTGYGKEDPGHVRYGADCIAGNLDEAVTWMLGSN
jgi:D-glycero-D-manno-heptose 1,7-bisphosphate phosphatase